MSLFLRYSQRKDIQYYAPDLTGPSGGDGNGYIHTIQQNAALGYTWVTTPSSIFEFRFGFTHVKAGKEPPYVGGPEPAIPVRFPGPADYVESYGRPEHADDQRFRYCVGTPDQQPSVSESHLVRSKTEFH